MAGITLWREKISAVVNEALFILVLAIYGVVLALLFVYGINFYALSLLTVKHRESDPPTPPLDENVRVTVQLPIYNERYVASRLINAVCRLDWPRDRLQIQVLDDSTDETVEIVAKVVAARRAEGLDIEHVRRSARTGYKAGALAHGLESATGELIAIFDADFLPPPDFLKNTVSHFADPAIGFVQTRWGHLNDGYSPFTRLQALSIDGHFMVEQFARQRAGLFMNFNGTAGVWRRQAIEEAGGWAARTLTEDLDLSYRAQLAGWKSGYLRHVVTPGELPVTINAYRRQQYRWARGSFETAIQLVPRLLRTPLPLKVKLEALLHLTGYGIHALMFTLTLLYPLVAYFSTGREWMTALFGVATVFNLTALAPTTYFTLAQHELGRAWWKRLPAILFLSAVGSGMMVNNVVAIAHAFTKRTAVFERTPKFGIVGKWGEADGVYSVHVSPLVIAEAAMLIFNLNTLRLTLATGHYVIAFYVSLFITGQMYLLILTTWQALRPQALSLRASLRKRPIGEQMPEDSTLR